MKKTLGLLILALACGAGAYSQKAIVFIEADGREPYQIDFLETQGYEVTVMEPFNFSQVTGPDTFNILNNADLVIIGRSPSSQLFRGVDAQVWHDSITSPVILNAQYIATGGPDRINWFESSNAYHANEEPELIYARVDTTNEIFTLLDIPDGDSIPWMYVPHDLLTVNDTSTNGAIAARYGTEDVLVVQNEGGTPIYDGGPNPAGPRTYFGFGNDAGGWDNLFPLTEEAQQVYFNEIQRLLGDSLKAVAPVNRTKPPLKIVFIEWEDREPTQRDFLDVNGFDVTVIEAFAMTDLVGTDTIDILNEADVVIIGRSPRSSSYRGEDAQMWNDTITSPVILNAQYIATGGPERINWFSSSSAYHANQEPELAYAGVTTPSEDIFAFVDIPVDSLIPWMYAPHDFLSVTDGATNGTIFARYGISDVLIVYSEAETPLYNNGPSPAGKRLYFGFGNDAGGWDNFFPLTDEAQQVYFNAIQFIGGRKPGKVVTVPPSGLSFSNDVTLSDLQVSGTTIDGFDPAIQDYTYKVDGNSVPVVTATATHEEAIIDITPALTTSGTTFVLVTAADKFTTGLYSVAFSPNTLNSIPINRLAVYPNPATNRLTLANADNISYAAIFNLAGEKILGIILENENDSAEISISELPAGFYLIRAYENNNLIGIGKFMKQ